MVFKIPLRSTVGQESPCHSEVVITVTTFTVGLARSKFECGAAQKIDGSRQETPLGVVVCPRPEEGSSMF